MSEDFFRQPILNSPYDYPSRHWELDSAGQPTQNIAASRRRADFITPIPKPKKRKAGQGELSLEDDQGVSTASQQYDLTSIINQVRGAVDAWRKLSEGSWAVTPETAQLLKHWRHHDFGGVRPFFCQVEAVETAIWLTEVAPNVSAGKVLLEHLAGANRDANPELNRLALKLATGAGKTTVMAMLIAWQTLNAVRRPGERFLADGRYRVRHRKASPCAGLGELIGPVVLTTEQNLRAVLRDASAAVPAHRFSQSFLLSEWTHIVDAQQLRTWEAYRDVTRLGRKTRLKESQRAQLWDIFARVWAALGERGSTTPAAMYVVLARRLTDVRNAPYDFSVIDECQDLGPSQLGFLAALGGGRPNALFFAGDLGQRIFQQPFSWLSQGVDVRGRSRTLRVNYRTSHQIRQQADRLLDPEITDMDGVREERSDTVSVFNGPAPQVRAFATAEEEVKAIATWLRERVADGVEPHEIGMFVRSEAQIERARRAMDQAGIACKALNAQVEVTSGYATIGVMHLAKGLEFRTVAVMACDDEVLPLQERIEQVGEDGDLQDVYDSERHLLYVASTRARDHLHVSGVEPVSEFLEDLCAPLGMR